MMDAFFKLVVGFLCGICGCLCASLGDVLLRHSHEEESDGMSPPPYEISEDPLVKIRWLRWMQIPVIPLRQKWALPCSDWHTWLLGMSVVCIGNPALICAGLALAPALLIISLSAFSMSMSVIFAVIFLGERLTMGGLTGSFSVGVGLFGMVMAFRGKETSIEASESLPLVARTIGGKFYIGLIVTLLTACVVAASTTDWSRYLGTWRHKLDRYARSANEPLRESMITKVSAALAAGIASGHAELGTKVLISQLSVIWRTSSAPIATRVVHDHGLGYTLVILGIILGLDIWLLNLCLRKGEALIIVPLRNAANMITGMIGGMVFLGEHPTHPFLLWLSLMALLGGAFQVSIGQAGEAAEGRECTLSEFELPPFPSADN